MQGHAFAAVKRPVKKAVKKSARSYDENNIERFAGLKGIRKRSNSYIGPNDANGLWTVVREPLDNVVDLALKGHNKLVQLVLEPKSNAYWIVDAGPGFPVAMKVFDNEHGQKERLNTLYVATGLVHSGSNFKDEEISRGVHGIGIKASNAMAKSFSVWTFNKGKWWSIHYRDATLVKDVAATPPPKIPNLGTPKGGTVVRVEPDMSLFMKGTKFPVQDMLSWFDLTAYLVPGVTCRIVKPDGKMVEIRHPGGPKDYVADKLKKLGAEAKPVMFLHNSPLLDIAIAFSGAEGDNVTAYTNGLLNKDGGEHIRANVDALMISLRPFWPKARVTAKNPKPVAPFKADDIREGLVGLVNCKVAAPKFNNQPKDKLIDERVYAKAKEEAALAWSAFWKKHPGLARELVQRAVELRSRTNDFLKDKQLIKKVQGAKKSLSSKLAAIQGNTPVSERELYLVEGDSAGGGLKRIRDRRTQAIFPCRGKPLNPIDTKQSRVNENAEIVDILAALGVNLASESNEPSINYGKVIMLADADVDGKHINTIWQAIIWKYVPHLFHKGCVYSVRSPLYKASHKGKVIFGMTKEECYRQAGTKNIDCTYLKGWGELNDEDLAIAIDPGVRTLIRINPPDRQQAAKFLQMMGAKTDYRKAMLGVEMAKEN